MTRSIPLPAVGRFTSLFAGFVPLAVAGCMSSTEGARGVSAANNTAIKAAIQQALESNESGMAQRWSDPATSSSGSILPVRTYQTSVGLFCRDYTVIIEQGGETRAEQGTACRDTDGMWKDVG